ncbi:MAG: histidine kinase [Flavobacteriaceae bacterium]|jgi:hypothetical protein|nr:histidine kinase [Flavobacteriaceae bacterium]
MAEQKTNNRILIHILVWIAITGVLFLQSYLDRGEIPLRLPVLHALTICIFYVNFSFLVPYFLLKKKVLIYISSVIILLSIAVTANKLIPFNKPPEPFEENIDIKNEISLFKNDKPIAFDIKKPPRKNGFFNFDLIFPLFFNLPFIVIGTTMKMYDEWNKNERKKQEIETKNKTTELHYLKHQLNPHFLFNSLNSIYSLTSKKSSDAPEAVIMLSELMRYMLYKTDNDFVMLKDELDYIQNYLKLQRLRIAKNENITINIHGSVARQKIRPLLLISFIENAFKHGTNFMGDTEVKILITIDGNNLHFQCINLIGNKKKDKENSGIGLANTKERLELLYPNKHNLIVKEENNKFMVELNLILA